VTTRERVLVIGATQGTGLHIVRRLLRDGYAVRVLAREPARAKVVLSSEVEIVRGDVTQANTLAAAMPGVDHVVLTAGVTHRPAGERLVRATVYDGTMHTLEAARNAGLPGQFLYMSALGTTPGSWLGFLLNRIKGNALKWRRQAAEEIRASGLPYTIIRAGILTNAPAGQRAIEISQNEYPMAPRYRVSRADVAEVFVQALRHPRTRNTSFDVVSTPGQPSRDWTALFAGLVPD
jgi:uncharacterized protein YbjT (DUF2867 family)